MQKYARIRYQKWPKWQIREIVVSRKLSVIQYKIRCVYITLIDWVFCGSFYHLEVYTLKKVSFDQPQDSMLTVLHCKILATRQNCLIH